jgi:hypothetical protein
MKSKIYQVGSVVLGLAVVFSLVGIASAAKTGNKGKHPVTAAITRNGNKGKPFIFGQPPVLGSEAVSQENSNSALTKSTSLKQVINLGSALIKQRLNYLAALDTKIAKSKLTDSQKATLKGLVDGQISALTALGNKIKADTDLTIAKADVQSIYTAYRIYGVFVPQIHLMMNLDAQTNYLVQLNTVFFPKIQTMIDQAKAQGQDVTARQTALDNAKTQAGNIQTEIDAAYNQIAALQPADYPTTSQTVIKATNTAIKKISSEFKAIRQSVK